MPDRARLLADSPADGPWNMAVDEALLRSATHAGLPILRLYRWAPATLSLGYFQRADDRRLHAPSSRCPMVRRSSGGGAIVHDRELTYSFIVSAVGRYSRHAEELYEVFHNSLIDTLAQFGVSSRMACDCPEQPPAAQQPFLCFLRRSPGDVVVDDAKVIGSAQRRHKTGLLQHGSILFGQSECAPELPGLADLSGRKIEMDEFVEIWVPKLGERLGLVFEHGQLSGKQRADAEQLTAERFGHASWTRKR